MAAKAGWICSAGSSGSASSLRSIWCIQALSRYTSSPDLLSNRSSTAWLASITIITVQLLTDAGLLQVHVFTVNMVIAPYTDIIHEEIAPDFFRKFTGKTRPCAQTILYRFRWQFQFRRVGLSAHLIVGELVCRRVGCRRFGLTASWFVGELDCRRVGLSASWLSASWFIGKLSSYRIKKCYR